MFLGPADKEVTAAELALFVRNQLKDIANLCSCDFSNCRTSRDLLEEITSLHNYLGAYLEKTMPDLNVHAQGQIISDADLRAILGRDNAHPLHPDHPTREIPALGEPSSEEDDI